MLNEKQCVMSIGDVFRLDLRIPNYQRPYKWTKHNITDLLSDMEDTILAGKSAYRVGTLVLHRKPNEFDPQQEAYMIVDGQQRILTFTLLMLALDQQFTCSILVNEDYQQMLLYDKISQKNLHDNFQIIREYLNSLMAEQRTAIKKAIEETFQFVVITVDRESEAFQLFDSQNTRGKRLDPHDLLKAYHLREIKDRYSMRYNTEQWEAAKSTDIRDLFNWYLYPIMNWAKRDKVRTFSERDIEQFKGVRASSGYRYGNRTVKAMPCFQLGEQFEAGEYFFGMVSHYLRMRKDIESEIRTNPFFEKVREVIDFRENSTGFEYSKRLFYCAVMAYYDRFGIFDIRAIGKLCQWAFTIRLDMEHLGFDTINKYAVGDDPYNRYSNCIPMFSIIKNSRSHLDVANILIKKCTKTSRNDLRKTLNNVF